MRTHTCTYREWLLQRSTTLKRDAIQLLRSAESLPTGATTQQRTISQQAMELIRNSETLRKHAV